MTKKYVGRFAPSPSGPLHFGSLVCALASYLDAICNHGEWLLRIDDIDPPREQPGATQHIINSLYAHGLHWHGDVFLQSQQATRYQTILQEIENQKLSYRCNCTRKRLAQHNFIYDQHCLAHPPPAMAESAIRLNLAQAIRSKPILQQQVAFTDGLQGHINEDVGQHGDFIIHRKDGFFAYQLAVAADDIEQGITHVVRGVDLLETTAKQVFLIKLLGGTVPKYSHIPVIIDHNGNKLSKQNHAPAIDIDTPEKNLFHAIKALMLHPPSEASSWSIKALIDWSANRWELKNLTNISTIKQDYILSL